MVRQGGRIQLEQSDMRLAWNMAKMPKAGFLCTSIQYMQQLMKEPRAEVQEEKKQGVQSPGHTMVNTGIDRHPAMVYKKSYSQQPSMPKWHSKVSADMLEAQRNRRTSTRLGVTAAQNATSARDTTSTWNTTQATRWQWWTWKSWNRRYAIQVCVYTFTASQHSIFNHNAYAKDSKYEKDFNPDLLGTLSAA